MWKFHKHTLLIERKYFSAIGKYQLMLLPSLPKSESHGHPPYVHLHSAMPASRSKKNSGFLNGISLCVNVYVSVYIYFVCFYFGPCSLGSLFVLSYSSLFFI